MDQSIADLLKDEPNEAPEAPEAVAEEPVEATPDRPRDEHGRFVPKGEEESASPAPVEEPQLDHAAIVAERRRRQEAEREREALKAELEALRNPPAEPPSVWEDEQGFRNDTVSEAVRQATFNARLDMSEMMVRQAHEDFEAVKAEFLALAEQNPTLRQQALADPHPWNKAYQIAKNHQRMTELGATDIAALEAKIREQVMAEMQTQQPQAPSALPPSLTTERNVGSRAGPAWAGPPSLSELLR